MSEQEPKKKPKAPKIDKVFPPKLYGEMVDVYLDGMLVTMPKRVALWMKSVFSDDSMESEMERLAEIVKDSQKPFP